MHYRNSTINTLAALLLSFVLIGQVSPVKATDPSSPMGITTRLDNLDAFGSNPWTKVEEHIKLAVEAGASWDRLFMPSHYIITSTGEINNDYLTKLDRLITLYKEYHLNAYMMLFNSSEFIGFDGNGCNIDDPLGWPTDLWHSPPKDKAKWAQFVSTLVDRYGDYIKYWEISFEENYPGCPFAEQPELYVNFLKETATIIRQHDPQAKIVLGRLLPRSNSTYFTTLLQKGAGPYFNVVSLGGPYQCTKYDNAAAWVTNIKSIMAEYNINKPIWPTEVFCVSDADGNGESDNAGHELQKTFIKEVYKKAVHAGAQKIFVNSLADRPYFLVIKKRMSGIITKDLQKKPSYSAYQQAARDAGFPPPSPTSNPADLNQDGKVDIYDYNILVADFGKTGSPGWIRADINKDGKVDIFDYNILVSNYDQ